jgi:hypothetical protein
MANKKSKKRTKRYQGEDAKSPAASSQPVVHRYEAVERNKLQQWWHEKKRVVKVSAAVGGGAVAFGWLVFELFQIIF